MHNSTAPSNATAAHSSGATIDVSNCCSIDGLSAQPSFGQVCPQPSSRVEVPGAALAPSGIGVAAAAFSRRTMAMSPRAPSGLYSGCTASPTTRSSSPPCVWSLLPMRTLSMSGLRPCTQCAAVTIWSGAISEPPQLCFPVLDCSETMNGYS